MNSNKDIFYLMSIFHPLINRKNVELSTPISQICSNIVDSESISELTNRHLGSQGTHNLKGLEKHIHIKKARFYCTLALLVE